MATQGYGGSIGAPPQAQQVNQFPQANAQGKPFPEMPTGKGNEPLLTNLGATGVAIFSGVITSEEYNPDFYWRDGIQIYEQMLRSEAQIQAIRNAIELPIRRATWSVVPGSDEPVDIEIASFVESCLLHEMCYTTTEGREIRQHWDDILRHILMHLWYGFMAFEIVYRKEAGWIKWAKWTPLLPRTVWRWWVGEDNELVGIQQWTFKNYNYCFVDIPVEKLLLFAHRQEGNNYEGVSLLRQPYKNWFFVQQFEKIEAIAEERNAVSIPHVALPTGFTSEMADLANTIVQNMRANEMAGVVLPETMPIEYIKNQQKYAAQVQPSIQYHQAQIARSILADFLQSTTTGTGSYAQTSARIDFFLLALQTVCEYIEDVINNDAIRKLVDYNFAGVEVYPRLKASKLTSANVQEVAAALQQLAAGQFMTPSPETEDWLRELLGAPSTPQSAVTATNPTAPETPEQPDAAPEDHGDGDQEPTNENGSAVGMQGEPAADGAALRELTEEAALLRLALAEARGLDAVERAVERETVQLYNPYPREAHGRFGHGGMHGIGGHGGHGGEEEGGGGGIHGSGARASAMHRGAGGGGGGGGGSTGARGSGARGSGARGEAEHSGGGARGARRGEAEHAGPSRAEMARGHAEAEAMHQAAVGKRGGGSGEKGSGSAKAKTTPEERRAELERKVKETHEEFERAGNEYERMSREVMHDNSYGASVRWEQARIAMNRAYDTHQRAKAQLKAHDTRQAKAAKAGDTTRSATTRGAKSTRSATPKAAKEAAEGIHERSARLQREQGLRAEVKPDPTRDLIHQEPLVPRGGMENFHYDPRAPLDPHFLERQYGEHQLGRALYGNTQQRLKEAADIAGVKPGRTKAETISRITAKVTEGRYSANFGAKGGSESKAPKAARAERASAKDARVTQGTPKRASLINEQPLVPQRTIEGFKYNPRAPLDPYMQHYVYGGHQLRQALTGYSAQRLREAVAIVQQHNPGTRPRSMSRKADMIDYMVERVTANPRTTEMEQQYGG